MDAVLPDCAHRNGVSRVGPAAKVHVVSLRKAVPRGKGEYSSFPVATLVDALFKNFDNRLGELVVVAISTYYELGKVHTCVGVLFVK